MAKPTKPRTRPQQDSKQRVHAEYESLRPERRPTPGAPSEPRLGPYEMRYDIDFGYSSPRAFA